MFFSSSSSCCFFLSSASSCLDSSILGFDSSVGGYLISFYSVLKFGLQAKNRKINIFAIILYFINTLLYLIKYKLFN
ncbi:hypothetical protein Bmayo_04595 (plasmid) [Borreliella mayonii]|uniref:Uncharacterized protein n=1 Tax=Borreliella mayonii TaxID=1674146 RepID=A0AAC9KYC2_9SPIR|nr:hypothetical protein A7X70_05815 [Borreliella mayonii]APT00429.1 hypothetical protein Bmayo_04595 [Borreliella mayonii]